MNKILKRTYWYSFTSYFLVMVITRYVNFPELDSFTRALYATPFWEYWDEYIAGHMRYFQTQVCYLSSREVADLLKENPQDNNNQYEANAPEKEYIAIRLQSNAGRTYGTLKCYFSNFPYPIAFNVSVPFSSIVEPYVSEGPGYRNFLILPQPANANPKKIDQIFLRWKNLF